MDERRNDEPTKQTHNQAARNLSGSRALFAIDGQRYNATSVISSEFACSFITRLLLFLLRAYARAVKDASGGNTNQQRQGEARGGGARPRRRAGRTDDTAKREACVPWAMMLSMASAGPFPAARARTAAAVERIMCLMRAACCCAAAVLPFSGSGQTELAGFGYSGFGYYVRLKCD